MEEYLLKLAKPIINKEKLSHCRDLSYNALLCNADNGDSVVLKVGERVTYKENKTVQKVLSKLQQVGFQHTVTPLFVAMSEEKELVPYIITSFIEAESPPWSENNDDPDLGGKNINLDYLQFVTNAIEDLESIDYRDLGIDNDKEQVTSALDTLEILNKEHLLDSGKADMIRQLLQEGAASFYDDVLIISNGDFYPGNVLKGNDDKTVVIDWDGARLTVREHMLMYFWCSMFNNPEFQNKLLEYYRNGKEFDESRFQFGLLMAALEDIRLWLKHDHCSEALAEYVSYLKRYKEVIKE